MLKLQYNRAVTPLPENKKGLADLAFRKPYSCDDYKQTNFASKENFSVEKFFAIKLIANDRPCAGAVPSLLMSVVYGTVGGWVRMRKDKKQGEKM